MGAELGDGEALGLALADELGPALGDALAAALADELGLGLGDALAEPLGAVLGAPLGAAVAGPAGTVGGPLPPPHATVISAPPTRIARTAPRAVRA